jgi:hypothetical protein
MLALNSAEGLKSRPDDNKPVTKRTTTQKTYKPTKKIGVYSSELLYNLSSN